jgi:hypothetical protein
MMTASLLATVSHSRTRLLTRADVKPATRPTLFAKLTRRARCIRHSPDELVGGRKAAPPPTFGQSERVSGGGCQVRGVS